MRNAQTAILDSCTSEQLFLLAIANAGLRPAVSRVLDARATRAGTRRAVVASLGRTQPAAVPALRRAG